MSGKKKVESVTFKNIEAAAVDYGNLRGEIEVITKHKTYEMKMGNELAQTFANQVLEQIL